MKNSDWMDRIEAASREKRQREQERAEQERQNEDAYDRMAPGFVSSVLSQLDEDVQRWNARPSSEKMLLVPATATSRCFIFSDRSLTVRYASDLRLLDVDISVGGQGTVAPNVVADSYELTVRDQAVIATRHGTSRRGSLETPAEVSQDILTALLAD
jgi:hypothetical protein